MSGIVITGGPGSGKSTLLSALEQQGYHCVQEASRQLIQQQVALGSHCIPWNDLSCFARLALDKMIFDFSATVRSDNFIFFDRGIPDIIAYMMVGRISVGQEFFDAAEKYRYGSQVFMAPPWKEIYVNDSERWQSFEEACKIYHALDLVYSVLGYDIIMLPSVPVENRTSFVLNTLSSVKTC